MARWQARQILLISVIAAPLGIGCSHSSEPVALTPSPVSTASFYRPVPGADDPHDSPVDRGGPIVAPVEARGNVQRITPTQAPKTPPAPAIAGNTTAPAGGTTAQYLTVGAIVIEVSGTPIYADKVLQSLTPILSAEAKQLDVDSYRAKAQADIITRVNDLIRTELYYAAAVKSLTEAEISTARRATEDWRKRQVSQAGGSDAKARAKAMAEGMSLDEKVQEQYRSYVIEIWYTRKIAPRIEVTREDMRIYYDSHRDKEFSDTAKAQFRIIKITATSMGGVDQAREKITGLRQDAVKQTDEEFAKTAGSINDPAFMRTQGRVGGGDGWVEKGAFAIQQVEDAIWSIQPGQVTEVIQVGDAFYIARMENRRDKRMRTFDDADVQQEIYGILSRPQILEQRTRMTNKVMENAVFNPPVEINEASLTKLSQPVLEMAMQKYPEWAGK